MDLNVHVRMLTPLIEPPWVTHHCHAVQLLAQDVLLCSFICMLMHAQIAAYAADP